MSTGWKTLTRDDLKTFDDNQTRAVLYAMEHGGVGRISNNGHAIIRNSTGQTMSVSRSGGGRRKINVANDLVRLFGHPEDTPKAKTTGSTSSVTPTPTTTNDGPVLKCLAPTCPETFVTEGARYVHCQDEHPFKCDECEAVFSTSRGRGGHVRIVHRGHKPALGNRGGGRRRKQTTPPQNVTPQTTRRPVETTPDVSSVEDSSTMLPTDPPKVAGIDTSPTRWAPFAPDEFMSTVRKMLGEDPRVTELQTKVDDLTRRVDEVAAERDDARAQLSLVREAMGL